MKQVHSSPNNIMVWIMCLDVVDQREIKFSVWRGGNGEHNLVELASH